MTMQPVSAQIEAMTAAIEADQEELIKVADDGRAYAVVLQRLQARRRELERLGHSRQLELRQEREAHVQALYDRVAEARFRYSEIRASDIPQIEQELVAIVDRLDELLPRYAAVKREIAGLSTMEGHAVASLRKLGEVPGHPTIGSPPCPSRDVAIRYWITVHELVAAAGLHAGHVDLMRTTRR